MKPGHWVALALTVFVAVTGLVLPSFAPAAFAQSSGSSANPSATAPVQPGGKSVFGGGADRAAATAAAAQRGEPGFFERMWLGLVRAQREVTQAMTDAVKRLKTSDPISSTAFLGLISFIYGVLHAVGPGHGKFVISSYALANHQTAKRGMLISFMAAAIQALSAIALVVVATAVMKATSIQMRATEAWLELASWAMVAMVGIWLLWRQAGPLLAARSAGSTAGAAASAAHAHDHVHKHHDHHGHAHHGHDHAAHSHAAHGHEHHQHGDQHKNAHGAHDHGHGHAAAAHGEPGHVHDEHCGHVHLPEPAALAGPWSWRDAWTLAFSIGIRPCTGAILVLIFASSIGLFWAGVFATFAMAIGTALTISALVAIAVGSRDLAKRMAGGDSVWAGRVERTVGVVGALLVVVLGVAGVVGSLSGASPL